MHGPPREQSETCRIVIFRVRARIPKARDSSGVFARRTGPLLEAKAPKPPPLAVDLYFNGPRLGAIWITQGGHEFETWIKEVDITIDSAPA